MTAKKSLLISLALIVLIALAGFLGTNIFRQTQLDESSQEFAIFITPLILSANPEETRLVEEEETENNETTEVIEAELAWEKYAHASLLQQQSTTDRAKYLFVVTRQLGTLQAIESISGSSDIPLPLVGSESVLANYSLAVSFSGGDAEVELSLIFENEQWLITHFEVVANVLAD